MFVEGSDPVPIFMINDVCTIDPSVANKKSVKNMWFGNLVFTDEGVCFLKFHEVDPRDKLPSYDSEDFGFKMGVLFGILGGVVGNEIDRRKKLRNFWTGVWDIVDATTIIQMGSKNLRTLSAEGYVTFCIEKEAISRINYDKENGVISIEGNKKDVESEKEWNFTLKEKEAFEQFRPFLEGYFGDMSNLNFNSYTQYLGKQNQSISYSLKIPVYDRKNHIWRDLRTSEQLFQLNKKAFASCGKLFSNETAANAEAAKASEGNICASCGNKFSWNNKQFTNLEEILEAYPEFKGKKLCKMCGQQYKRGIKFAKKN